jgi:hypothetical protein
VALIINNRPLGDVMDDVMCSLLRDSMTSYARCCDISGACVHGLVDSLVDIHRRCRCLVSAGTCRVSKPFLDINVGQIKDHRVEVYLSRNKDVLLES